MKGRTPHPFVVASLAVVPSYVSYLSALNYYGISDQVPRVVQMATTLRAEPFTYGGMRMEYHILRPDKFYGYGPEHFAPLEGLVALPEKALIDSFDRPALVGGGQEVVRLLLSSVRDIDIRRMRTLLKTFPSRSTISRICYILERNGHESDSLRSLGSKTYIPLVPGGKSEGNLDKGWNVYVDEGVIPRSPENS
nr:hypothetical protein [Thermoplasmata archaeon]